MALCGVVCARKRLFFFRGFRQPETVQLRSGREIQSIYRTNAYHIVMRCVYYVYISQREKSVISIYIQRFYTYTSQNCIQLASHVSSHVIVPMDCIIGQNIPFLKYIQHIFCNNNGLDKKKNEVKEYALKETFRARG